jgi:hypothetical protein
MHRVSRVEGALAVQPDHGTVFRLGMGGQVTGQRARAAGPCAGQQVDLPHREAAAQQFDQRREAAGDSGSWRSLAGTSDDLLAPAQPELIQGRFERGSTFGRHAERVPAYWTVATRLALMFYCWGEIIAVCVQTLRWGIEVKLNAQDSLA